MKRVILMRHAKTEPWTHGIDDFARQLTDSGHAAANDMTKHLFSQGYEPDQILVSSARRTRETCKYASDIWPDAKITVSDELYLAGERGLRDALLEASAANSVLLIGHNPGLHDLALSFVREFGSSNHRAAMKLANKLSTGSVAIFETAEPAPLDKAELKLKSFIRPKDLLDL